MKVAQYSPKPASKRPDCNRCLRPEKTCICALSCRIDNPMEVIILQHPLEQRQSKGTARLLHLCLQNSRILCGEIFAPETLNQFLLDGKHNLLLYPASPDHPSLSALPCDRPAETCRLVVLDGTWRKSRKLLHLNPLLTQLPRVQLPGNLRSGYRIRKAQAEHQLSTLEATAQALSMLEDNAGRYQTLWRSFEDFINFQQGLTPPQAGATDKKTLHLS